MKFQNKKISKYFSIGIFLLFFSIVVGCASTLTIDEKAGAALWGENCGRCHNVRPPATLSDSQWNVALLHMRTRANLTETEAEKIVAFLKIAN